ncbi:hypothetical protein ACSBR2_018863 [Camellia fascicularis]
MDIVMSTNPGSYLRLDYNHQRLLEALPKILPTAYHYFCLQHLKANLRDRFSGPSFSNTFRSRIVFLFSSCAYAPTVGCFN